MPIYAYRCESCGHTMDALQKISDAPLADCPACGQAALRKQVTAAGFQLKGSGWYVTDFRGEAKKGAAEKKDDAGTTAAPAEAAKAESAKPEAPKAEPAKAASEPAAAPSTPATPSTS
jgi:putative FmdB family regulatory protein